MFTTFASRLGSAIIAFARYRISALGVRKFIAEAAGIYAIDEIVEEAAKYNDWIDENQDKITLGLSLSLMAKNTLLSILGRGGALTSVKLLFSRANMAHNIRHLASWMQTLTIKGTTSGVEIVRNGRVVLKLARDGANLVYSHNGTPAVAAILAAGLGGAVPATRQDWIMTGEQLAAQISDMEYSLAEHQLRSRLYDFSAGTLFNSGNRLVESFLREHPGFSAEKAFATLMDVLSTEDTVAGYHSLDGFKDHEGDNIIRIDGTYFKREDKDNTFILKPAIPAEGPRYPMDDEFAGVLPVMEAVLEKVRTDGGVSLIRVAKTSRFISTPFTISGLTASLVVDLENPVPHFVFAEESFFDDSKTNLEDDLDASAIEQIEAWVSTFPDVFGPATREFKEDAAESAFEQRVRNIIPLLGASYRSGILYLDAEGLSDGLGKFQRV